MEAVFEILLGLGELLLELFGEVLIENGIHALQNPTRTPTNPWLAGVGYAFLGAVVGGLSLWMFPNYLVVNKNLRLANVVLSSIAAGLFMMLVGKWRAKRGQAVLRIDRFLYGYLFALGFSVVRFLFAQ